MAKEKRGARILGPLLGTIGFLMILICLFAALCASLARFEPDFPRYLDHIQERLAPMLQAVQKGSPAIDRLGGWLNPGNGWVRSSGDLNQLGNWFKEVVEADVADTSLSMNSRSIPKIRTTSAPC